MLVCWEISRQAGRQLMIWKINWNAPKRNTSVHKGWMVRLCLTRMRCRAPQSCPGTAPPSTWGQPAQSWPLNWRLIFNWKAAFSFHHLSHPHRVSFLPNCLCLCLSPEIPVGLEDEHFWEQRWRECEQNTKCLLNHVMMFSFRNYLFGCSCSSHL